jgi:hypothetical protein
MACDAASAARYFTPVLPATTAAASTKASPAASAASASSAASAASAAVSASPTAAVVDPYDQSRNAWSLCGVMSGPTP